MTKHSRLTRLIHMVVACLVVVQLLSSLVMIKPTDNQAENIFFEIHEYSGISAFIFIFAFFITTLLRRRGTAPALLFPWFSKASRGILLKDIYRHISAVRAMRFPDHNPNAAFPSAVHGLGILLIMAMATTGGMFFIALYLGVEKTLWATTVIQVHTLFGSLVWAYLIGHAAMAFIHHFAKKQPLSDMWSIKK